MMTKEMLLLLLLQVCAKEWGGGADLQKVKIFRYLLLYGCQRDLIRGLLGSLEHGQFGVWTTGIR